MGAAFMGGRIFLALSLALSLELRFLSSRLRRCTGAALFFFTTSSLSLELRRLSSRLWSLHLVATFCRFAVAVLFILID
jgi:hypothetical protein